MCPSDPIAQGRAEGFRDGIERAAAELDLLAEAWGSLRRDAQVAQDCARAIRALAPIPDSHATGCDLDNPDDDARPDAEAGAP